jgi:hypothetical protein
VDLGTLVNRVNTEFKAVCEFFRANKLVLHPGKTKFILYSRSKIMENIEIFCDNNNAGQNDDNNIHKVERVGGNETQKSIKFLGVLFDDDLSFKMHIQNLKSKLSKALYLLRTSKNILPKESLTLLYYSVFHSHLIYAINIWSTAPPSAVNSIFKLQKKAIRILTNSKYNAHTEPLFKHLEILTVPDLISFFQYQFVHRYVNNKVPRAFEGMWVFNNERQIGDNSIILRNHNQILVPLANTKTIERIPYFSLPKLWNNFENNAIKSIGTCLLFDSNLKQMFIDDLNDVPVCNRLFCPACAITN